MCDDGFDCKIKKEIHATVRVNSTLQEFNSDVNGIRTAFIAAVAKAANVTEDKVIILGVSESRRRRLLSHPHTTVVHHKRDTFAESMQVQTTLKQAIHLRNLRKRMDAPPIRQHTNAVASHQPPFLMVHHKIKK